jgi:RNA-directed DNA polymerase
MSLQPPIKVQKLQEVLHTKAKEAPSYRFYALYDKLYREDVLLHAYERCQENEGAAGVDGQTFADIAEYGRDKWLGELASELRQKTYRPQAVRRVWIPKADGKQRPLGIPTVKDRVVQTAALLVLEPIFEADLQPEQYAYRAERSALDAVQVVKRLLKAGHTQVVDADLSGYFDSIPHAELLRCLARRISDRHLLSLIARWLEMPVEETDERGRPARTTRNKDEGRGTPQGAPLSPLLSNLYMRRFILAWKKFGYAKQFGAPIVNYADDFVICCRRHVAEATEAMRQIMRRLKLTVNETKTRTCRVPDDTFTFLGYTIGRRYSWRTGEAYLDVWPAAKKVQGICATLSEITVRSSTGQTVGEIVQRLNARIRGWANYFRLGTVGVAYQAVHNHACLRLRQWLGHKSGQRVWASRLPDKYLHATLGLIDRATLYKARAFRVQPCGS